MGRWAQYRKRGRGVGPTSAPPAFGVPVFLSDWTADPTGSGEITIQDLQGCPQDLFIGFRFSLSSTPGMWVLEGVLGCESSTNVPGLVPSANYDVQAAYFTDPFSMSPAGAWSATTVVAAGT